MYQLLYADFEFVIYNTLDACSFGFTAGFLQSEEITENDIRYNWFTPNKKYTHILSAESVKDLLHLLTTKYPELLI